MKNKDYIKAAVVVLLAIGLIFAYINRISQQSELGMISSNLVGNNLAKLEQTITYLEGGNLDTKAIQNDLHELTAVSRTAASTSGLSFLNLHFLIIREYDDFERIYRDKDYRENLITMLNKYLDALNGVSEEEQKRANPEIRFLRSSQGKLIYDYYFLEKPIDRIKYRTKAEEIFFAGFNK